MGPFSSIEEQTDYYFPAETDPYHTLMNAVQAAADRPMTILDIGCGHGAPYLRKFIGKGHTLFGIDLIAFDQDALELDGMTLINENASKMKSFADNSIDLAFSCTLMEHVVDVDKCFDEIARVLKPGAPYIFLTPNRYDYASFIARLIPNRYHQKVVKLTEGRDEADTFPTYYKANDFKTIQAQANRVSLTVSFLERLQQHPCYFSFSRPLFWLGIKYEHVINAVPFLHVLKGWIFCELRKPES